MVFICYYFNNISIFLYFFNEFLKNSLFFYYDLKIVCNTNFFKKIINFLSCITVPFVFYLH